MTTFRNPFTIGAMLEAGYGACAPGARPKYWMGSPPTECDICHNPLVDTFIDGATNFGPWANMCTACHKANGRGLGTGKGQKYEKQPDGRWLKTGG